MKILSKIKKLKEDFGKIGFWAGFSLVMPIFGLTAFISVIYNISPWLQANQTEGIFAFILSVAVLAGLAIIPTNVVGMVSGYAFDFKFGLLAMFGAIIGALAINYFISKRLAGKNFQEVLEKKPKLKAVHKALLKESFFKAVVIIVLMRLSPALPFAATNFMISASGVSLKTFLLGTILGHLPRTSATVFVGSSLSELNFNQPQESWLIFVGIGATICATIIVGILSKRALNRMTMETA